MKKLVFSGLVFWLSIMSSSLLAADYNWEDIGGENLNCQVLLVNAQESKIIFLGKPGTVLKTDNSGKSWRRVLVVRGRESGINALVAEKNNYSVIYAATGNGLYRSTDSGERWERIFSGKIELENQCMTVLGMGEIILVGTKAGLFISRDNGRIWYKQQVGIGSKAIINIESGAAKDADIYLVAACGILRSLDKGKSWKSIFIDNRQKEITEEFATEDAELTEKKSVIYSLKVDRNNSSRLYFCTMKGVYKSSDYGQSWEKLTEYGLLDRDVKMIYLADNSELYALTKSGVFLYRNERWMELSMGLVAGKLNYLVLDNRANIYIAGEKGLFRWKPTHIPDRTSSVMLQEYLKHEPCIKDVQRAAIKYAEVDPEKIARWRKQASKKAWLPKLSADLGRNTTDLWHWETGSSAIGQSGDDLLRRGKDSLDWDVSISWDLSELIWSADQTSIDVRSKLMVELRDDILDQVNKLYFERLRLQSELDNLAIEDKSKRFDKQLKLAELTAALDSLTAGYYSEQLRLLALKL